MTGGRSHGWLRMIRGALTQNLGLKLVSLSAALVLFSAARGAEDEQMTLNVPVVVVMPESSRHVLTSEQPETVRVTLRGSRAALQAMRRDGLDPVQVSLRDPAARYFYFDANSIETPAGVRVEQIVPSEIRLTWARKTQKSVPVVAAVTGEPAPGLTLRRPIEVEPSLFLLSGPDDELAVLERLHTAVVDVSALDEGTHVKWVAVEGIPPHAIVDEGHTKVRVTLNVAARLAERAFRNLEVSVVGGSPQARVRPGRVDVVVRGSPDAVASVGRDRLVPFVEATASSGAGAVVVPVRVGSLPEGVDIVSTDPPEVLLEVGGRTR